jgi:hypothetical protein
MSLTVPAIDVSSHQGRDLSAIIARYRPQLVVCKLYLPLERYTGWESHPDLSPGMTIDQARSARENGVQDLSGYVWGYRDVDPDRTVYEGMETAYKAEISSPVLWLDAETYQNTAPEVAWFERAVYVADTFGLQLGPGFYSAPWFWNDYLGATQLFAGRPGWGATYNGMPGRVASFGGLRMLGHQFSADQVDQNVFDELVITGPTVAPSQPDPLEWALSSLGYLSHEFADGLEGEARRSPGPRRKEVIHFAEQLRRYAPA